MNAVIDTRDLVRRFGPVEALRGLNLQVAPGDLYGLVGPDGAGKTTTLRILAGILAPTEGRVSVLGLDLPARAEELHPRIAYMPQRFGLYEDLTVEENIAFYADLYGVDARRLSAAARGLLDQSGLSPFGRRLAGRLSGGMKQKLGLVCALIHTPELLLLDEPTNGVDPVSRREFWKMLYGLLGAGITVFVSTSYLDEAQRCTTVGLIHAGRLLDQRPPGEMMRRSEIRMLEVWTPAPREAARALRRGNPGLRVTVYGDRLHAALENPGQAAGLLEFLKGEAVGVTGSRVTQPSLEDIFILLSGTP